ncbi:hypothetical protein OROHE_006384 [Orobanche hederae]
MDSLKKIIVSGFFAMAICGFCEASIYKVGDGDGWAIMNQVDYNEWASSKIFKVGDTLVFEYNPGFHSVLQVSQFDFYSCNTAAPISTYTTGNDSIVINSSGNYYYICGFMGHCEAGQKVDIRVPNSQNSNIEPILSPAQTPSEPVIPNASSDRSITSSSAEPLMFNNGLFSSKNIGLLLILLWAVI